MNDLLKYLRGLYVADAQLLALFQAAGAPRVIVRTPDEREKAAYPCILLWGDEGQAVAQGDDGPPRLFDGRLRREIVTRKGDACPEPLATLRAIQARCDALTLGDRAEGLPGVKGRRVSAAHNVTVFRQVNPTGPVPAADPLIKRHLATYAVQINRTAARP